MTQSVTNKKALIIGIDSNKDLKQSVYNDVDILSLILKERSFEVKTLTDAKKEVSVDKIKKYLRWLREASTISYFHFSGHSKDGNSLKINERDFFPVSGLIHQNSNLIASFDCCDSFEFKLRWKMTAEGIISNSCEYNIRKDIIFITTSVSNSTILNYKGKYQGALSVAIAILLQREQQIDLSILYSKLNDIYRNLESELNQRIIIYAAKKYNIYSNIKF